MRLIIKRDGEKIYAEGIGINIINLNFSLSPEGFSMVIELEPKKQNEKLQQEFTQVFA